MTNKSLTPDARDHALDKLNELLVYMISHAIEDQNRDQAILCKRALLELRTENIEITAELESLRKLGASVFN